MGRFDIAVSELLIAIARDAPHEDVDTAVGSVAHRPPDRAVLGPVVDDVDVVVGGPEARFEVSRVIGRGEAEMCIRDRVWAMAKAWPSPPSRLSAGSLTSL